MDPSSLNRADFRSHSSPEAALEASRELPSHRRRVRVTYERSKAVVLRAVPKGCRLARHVVAWKRAALEHPALELMRADGRSNMAALVEIIAVQQDPGSRTWRTTWAWVAQRLGVHEDSVGRMIRRLKDWGLLAVVATGRSAAYTPRSSGKKQGISQKDAATPRPSAKAAAQRREVQAALGQRTAPLWPAHVTVRPSNVGATRSDWKQAYRWAGLEIQHHTLVLRRITTAYVVAVAKAYFQAGWTVADVLHALDWTPAGVRYTHDAVTGIEHPGAWFAARLRAWTFADGTPHRSPDQRAAAEAEQRRAEAVAAAVRHAARQAAAEAGAGGVAVRSGGEVSVARRPLKERFAAAYAAGLAEAAQRISSDGNS
ncbi:hypothetical protein PLESTB_001918900 [Pleodorina starrii]|uniref:Uncharacterized protein n=1 Tax=Pleodorina starrii TaxID=330485 RepID=A0A9W6FAR0_9CHLO|nr:hypothetical protein PLESTB_001918900 [Pleodorina starrii]